MKTKLTLIGILCALIISAQAFASVAPSPDDIEAPPDDATTIGDDSTGNVQRGEDNGALSTDAATPAPKQDVDPNGSTDEGSSKA